MPFIVKIIFNLVDGKNHCAIPLWSKNHFQSTSIVKSFLMPFYNINHFKWLFIWWCRASQLFGWTGNRGVCVYKMQVLLKTIEHCLLFLIIIFQVLCLDLGGKEILIFSAQVLLTIILVVIRGHVWVDRLVSLPPNFFLTQEK